MGLPESVQKIIAAVVEKNGSDIDAAVNEAESRVRRLKDFEDLQRGLVRDALRAAIHDRRHSCNVSLRRENREYGGPAKVSAGSSDAVNEVHRSCYGYYIGSTMLGSLLGNQLPKLAEAEEARAEGHQFNAALLRKLAPLVPEDKTVQQSVSATKLQKMFRELQRKSPAGAAA